MYTVCRNTTCLGRRSRNHPHDWVHYMERNDPREILASVRDKCPGTAGDFVSIDGNYLCLGWLWEHIRKIPPQDRNGRVHSEKLWLWKFHPLVICNWSSGSIFHGIRKHRWGYVAACPISSRETPTTEMLETDSSHWNFFSSTKTRPLTMQLVPVASHLLHVALLKRASILFVATRLVQEYCDEVLLSNSFSLSP